MGRFTLGGALWFVAFVALGFAAIRSATELWVWATFVVTLGLLCASVLGAFLERARGGAWWLGFALFGWAYLIAGLVPGLADDAKVASTSVARNIYVAANGRQLTTTTGRLNPFPGGLSGQEWAGRMSRNAPKIGHWFFVLAFARVGATVSCVFTKGLKWQKRSASDPAPAPSPVP